MAYRGGMNTPNRAQPPSVPALFWAFSWLALQGFGGVLAVVQRELVEQRRWLTQEEFVDDWAVAQIMPGANVVNLALIVGDRYFGWRGAVAALAGMLALPLCVVLLLTVATSGLAHQSAVRGALGGMAAVSAGLVASTGLKLVTALRVNAMGTLACASLVLVTFVAIALLRVPLIWVLLCLGVPATLWAHHCLLKQVKDPEGGR